jgi:hypothetical protein
MDKQLIQKSKDEYFYKKSIINNDVKKRLIDCHCDVFMNRRKEDLELKKFNKKTVGDYQWIVDMAYNKLDEYGIDNYCDDFLLEFQQRNCFGPKKNSKLNIWHTDSNLVSIFKQVYTVLFYIRKDKTLKGGNYKCEPTKKFFGNKSITIEINEGDCLVFDGNMSHCGENSSGFGCRDVVAVFIEKKKGITIGGIFI